MIRYDGKTQNLHTKPEKFRNELYHSSGDGGEKEWNFSGLINHSLEIQKMEEASAGLDKALETLQSQMASIKQQRDAQKCVFVPLRRREPGFHAFHWEETVWHWRIRTSGYLANDCPSQ